MHEDFERCLRAVQSKDARFDGWFFTAVRTTGIYCRPSCPAVPPKARNMRFYPSAAAAQQAGFRACKRCRPDASPGSPEWNVRADLVARAMRLIADGVVDREGVPGLASRLGYSTRQIQRQLLAELGAGPLALARAQRAQTARLLIETTSLPMGDVAFASGFASIRAFNGTVREVFAAFAHGAAGAGRARTPGGTPRRTVAAAAAARPVLPRQPLRPPGRDGRARRRGMAGRRVPADAAAAARAGGDHAAAAAGSRRLPLALTDLRDLATAVSRCRRLLDLDADPVAVSDVLQADPVLTPLVTKAPGRRVPRTVDPNEFALRAVLGQQVSTSAARTHAARLARACGEPVTDPAGGLDRLFPEPTALAGLDPELLAMPKPRRDTFIRLAGALANRQIDLGAGSDWQQAREQLAALPGIGPWTVETIAMRALGDPDAFTATDLGVRLAARELGLPGTPAGLTKRAAAWRPWRAYAVQYLWATGEHAINQLPA